MRREAIFMSYVNDILANGGKVTDVTSELKSQPKL